MEWPELDPNAPATEQIEAFYSRAIEGGRLRAGDRLPPIREVASRLAVTRTLVQDAYRRLAEMGLVEATVGRGTTVRDGASYQGPLSPVARAAYEHLHEQSRRAPSRPQRVAANFAEMHPDEGLFPVAEFQESLCRVLGDKGPALLSYNDPSGDAELRRVLASRVSSVDAGGQPEDVLVTAGAQQGIDLVLRAFTRPGDAVAVPMPTYHHLFGLLKAHGLQLLPLRSDSDAVLLEDVERALARPELRLIYIMPTFANPTGHTMSLATREAFLAKVKKTQVPVLEDDFDLDLRFRGAELPSLRAMDPRELTVTVRTFSKGLFPGVRIGWIHAGPSILGPVGAMKRFIDLETSPLLQAALLDFVERGLVDRYLQKLRSELWQRHDAAQEALVAHMPKGSQWTKPDGGFALWLEPPAGIDGRQFALAAAEQGVLVSPGELFQANPAATNGVRISISRSGVDEVRSGLETLGQCAQELVTRNDRLQGSPIFM